MMTNIYKTKRWKRKREVILRQGEYLCQESKRYGKSVTATTVHHIFPVDKYPELAFMNENLLALCESKHNEMHDRVTNEITEKGKAWQKKIAPLLEKKGFKVPGTGGGSFFQ